MSSGSPDLKIMLLESLKHEGILKSIEIENALLQIDRNNFMWDKDAEHQAYLDVPLALGETRQTISAPHMVVIMLEQAELSRGMSVLEIGTGSGYNAALLAKIVCKPSDSDDLCVTSIERNPELVIFARRNLERIHLEKQVQIIEGDGSLGYPKGSNDPLYDRIIVTAGAPFVPPHLEKQLKEEGILLIPVGEAPYQNLLKIKKTRHKEKMILKKENLMAVSFVPLVGEAGYSTSPA